jgi:hypothetical protein
VGSEIGNICFVLIPTNKTQNPETDRTKKRGPNHHALMDYVEYYGLLAQRERIVSQAKFSQQDYDDNQVALANFKEENRRWAMGLTGNSATSGESSTDIPARRSDGENNTNLQKRKREDEHERRPSQLGSVSLDAVATESSQEKYINGIRAGNQEVCTTLKYSCL